jgi:hypothetical protein
MVRMINTTVRIPEHIWEALRILAGQRALEQGGGRPSASAVVAELVQREAERRNKGQEAPRG